MTKKPNKMKIMPVVGTRPEAMKLVPVIKEMESHSEEFEVVLVTTVQHRQMFDQVLRLFGITPSHDLEIMENHQTLSRLTARIIDKFDPIVRKEKPGWILIQRDTTITFVCASAGFHHEVGISNIGAGLRTRSKCTNGSVNFTND